METKKLTTQVTMGAELQLQGITNVPMKKIVAEFEQVLKELKGFEAAVDDDEIASVEVHQGKVLLALSKGIFP